jgi:hypothetical protein
MSRRSSRSVAPFDPPRAQRCGVVARACLLALTGALAAALFSPAPAQAQLDDSSAATYWRRERERMEARQRSLVQRPTRMIRGLAPRQGFAREGEPGAWRNPALARPDAHEGAPRPSATHAAPSGAAETAPGAPAAPPFTIAVLGDNVGLFLAQGLQEAFADRAHVVILRKARENTGLARDDYYDWPKAARELLAGPQKIDAAVMLVGSNDRQPLREGAQSLDPRAPRWREIYAARAQAFADAFRDKGVPLVWVGAPVMQNERLSAGLLELNEIYRETAERAGAGFVDTWEGFVDERHRFTMFGPDVNGLTTRLRASDGVHFTRAGARKLAYFTEGDLRRLMERAAPAPAAPEAILAPPAATTPEPLRAAAPPEAPAVVVPARPDKGPVLPLTGAALSPGGELARPLRAKDPLREGDARAIVERRLLERRATEAPAGRADDFSWPR